MKIILVMLALSFGIVTSSVYAQTPTFRDPNNPQFDVVDQSKTEAIDCQTCGSKKDILLGDLTAYDPKNPPPGKHSTGTAQ